MIRNAKPTSSHDALPVQPRFRSWSLALILGIFSLTLLAAPAANAQGAASPADAFKRFASALSAGKQDEAWLLLSEATRFELTNAARRAAKAQGLPAPKDGKSLAFGSGLTLQREIKEVKVAERSGDRARLEIVDDQGEVQSATVVQEKDGWHLDFSEELRALPRQ